MTSVANQPVGGDNISGSIKGGTKSANSNHAGFLGSGSPPNVVPNPQTAGTLGGSTGPGHGLPGETAANLTAIDHARKY